jgi:hypothetical protein
MSFNFVPAKVGNRNCDDYATFGNGSTRYDYIIKGLASDDNYSSEACYPWVHLNAQIDNLQVNYRIHCDPNTVPIQSWKGFDIPHPNKKDHRLRHICLEGPEGGVYFRGKLVNENVINFPDYWTNLIDPETVTISLTQIGYSQDLIVDKIEWGKRALIRSGNGANINCYYVVHAARIDGEPLIVEYEGKSPSDYPGDPSQYSISGHDYGRIQK